MSAFIFAFLATTSESFLPTYDTGTGVVETQTILPPSVNPVLSLAMMALTFERYSSMETGM